MNRENKDMSVIEYENVIAFHPGYYVKETIEELEITQKEFSKRLDVTEKTLSKFLAGKAPLSMDIARKLSTMLGTSIGVWLNLQKEYAERIAEIEELEHLGKEKGYLGMIDYGYFVRLGLVESTNDPVERIKRLCKYLNISSLQVLERSDLLTSYRSIDDPNTKNRINSNAWLQTAVNIGKEMEVEPFDNKKLTECLSVIRSFTTESPKFFYPKLQEIFKSCGVAFVVLPHLKCSGIHGAVTWVNQEKAILAINDSLKSTDVFWFSLFHEIKHVLQQKVKMTIISKDSKCSNPHLDEVLEQEANEFARDLLVPAGKYLVFVANNDFSKEAIVEFSDQVGIDPGIVVGRLQKEGRIPYTWHQSLKRKYQISINQSSGP